MNVKLRNSPLASFAPGQALSLLLSLSCFKMHHGDRNAHDRGYG